MTDSCTRHVCMLAGIEVKRAAGKIEEAQAQAFTWLGAGIISLNKLRGSLENRPENGKRLPLFGWTVVGHKWEAYMAYDCGPPSAGVQIVGSIQSLNGSTENIANVFHLLKVLHLVKQYAKDTYWPWLKADLLDPLLQQKTSSL